MATFKNNIDKRHYFRFIFNKKFTNYTKKKYYPISERNIFDDIHRKINKIKEKFRTK
jgi:hypothetical protein